MIGYSIRVTAGQRRQFPTPSGSFERKEMGEHI